MAAKNQYLEKQRAMNDAYFKAGLESGRQQILDMVSLVLHDPAIMEKDTFGKERLLKVIKGVGEKIDEYQLAWEKHDETDVMRARLDEALAEAYGGGLRDTFHERYPYAPEYDYVKGKWK